MTGDCSPLVDKQALKPLRYRLEPGFCDPDNALALQLEIVEVLGTHDHAVTGARFLVEGTYELSDGIISKLKLAAIGTSLGNECPIKLGTGPFVISAEVKRDVPEKDRVLDLLMEDQNGLELGVRLRLVLEGFA